MNIPQRVSNISLPQFDVINAQANAWRERGAEVISLGQALPGFSIPQVVLDAAQQALQDKGTNIYSADAGIMELRKSLCYQLAKEYQADLDPDKEIIITAGANQALTMALLTLLEPGDEVLLPSPYFLNHEMAVRAVGAIPVEITLKESTGFRLSLQDIEPYLSSKTRAVVIVSPSNPTGAVYDPDEMSNLVGNLLKRDIYPIADETYQQFVYEDARHYCLASHPHWRNGALVVGSFSKTYAMTGWRVGYLIAPSDFITEALKIQDTMLICAPVISQKAVLAAVNQVWDYPLRFRDEFNQRRNYLVDRLDEIPALHWNPTQGGFFAFVRVDGCHDSQRLAKYILDTVHVVTIPGSLFGKAGEGFLRLSYGSVSMEDLEESCTRLEKYFQKHKQGE